MSTSVMLAVLSLGEMLLLAAAVIYFIFRRNRKLNDLYLSALDANAKTSNHAKDTSTPEDNNPQLNINDHLQTLIDATQLRAQQSEDEQAELFNKRVALLQTEQQLLKLDPGSKDYWNTLTDGLSNCFALPRDDVDTTLEELEDETTELAELDDPGDISAEEEIPNDESQTNATLPANKTDEEIDRLRSIISRQFSTIDDLKNELLSVDSKLAESETVRKKIEKLEVAQAQLNMCIDTLENENDRLKQSLQKQKQDKFTQVVNGETHEDNEELQAELTLANQRIENLERQSSHLTQQITELEYEIETLNSQLEEKNRLLARYEADAADLSKSDEDTIDVDPDKLKLEIEQLTERLMEKSELLSSLQAAGPLNKPVSTLSTTAVDDEFDNIPELTDAVSTKQKPTQIIDDDTENEQSAPFEEDDFAVVDELEQQDEQLEDEQPHEAHSLELEDEIEAKLEGTSAEKPANTVTNHKTKTNDPADDVLMDDSMFDNYVPDTDNDDDTDAIFSEFSGEDPFAESDKKPPTAKKSSAG